MRGQENAGRQWTDRGVSVIIEGKWRGCRSGWIVFGPCGATVEFSEVKPDVPSAIDTQGVADRAAVAEEILNHAFQMA